MIRPVNLSSQRIARLGLPASAFMAIGLTAAADIGDDVSIETADGHIIDGRMSGISGDSIMIDVGFTKVSFDSTRIRTIRCLHGDTTIHGASKTWRLETSLACERGLVRGAITGRGSVLSIGSSTPNQFDSACAFTSFHAATLDCTGTSLHSTPIGLPYLGARFIAGKMSGSAISAEQHGAALIAGFRFPIDAGFIADSNLGAGWMRSSIRRELSIIGPYGADIASARATMDGPMALVSAGILWQHEPWSFGPSFQIAWQKPQGTSDWASSQGLYRGRDDLSGSLIAISARFSLGLSW